MLNNFLSNINNRLGLQKSSRFNVLITGGPSVTDAFSSSSLNLINGEQSRTLSLLCESVEIPGKSFITADAKIYGPTFKIPYQTQFQEITCTFLCTGAMSERDFFERWMDSISNTSGSLLGTYKTFNYKFPSTYYGNIVIRTYKDVNRPDDLSKNEYSDYEIEIREAFPISMAAQSLNWSDDGFLRLSVQFAYRYYQSVPGIITQGTTLNTKPQYN